MAVKASITITISKYRDCDSITRYFKLQASTAAAPAIPTTLNPSGWSTAEPTYTSGSTNTLYYTDCYVFSDGTFQYTDDGNGKAVKSSSYEAAKEAYNKAQAAQNTANTTKEYTDAVSSQYGYRYKKDIVVYGERTDRYYPVYLGFGNQDVSREILITRAYMEQAPSDWNTAIHKGALNLKIKANYGSWGGATYKVEILELSELYCNMFADVYVSKMYGYGIAIWLRGGGTTGAKYHIYSDQPIERTDDYWHCTVPYIGVTDAGGVQFGWNGGTEESPTYKWVTDGSRSTVATQRIQDLQALVTATTAKTNASTAQTTADYAKDKIDNLKIGGRNLLQGTKDPVLSNSTYDAPYYKKTSGGNGIHSIETINDSPISGLSKTFRITGNTSGNRDFCQEVKDIKSLLSNGESLMFSSYVRSIGENDCTALIRIYSDSGERYNKSITVSSNWQKIEALIGNNVTLNSGDARFQFGLTGTGSIEYIGPKLECGNKATEWTPAPEDINASFTNMTNYIDQNVEVLQQQIDGAIQFWNGPDIPTINNYPANNWTTDDEKTNHIADIYTVIQDVQGELKQGKGYRFDKVGNNWVWVEITDNELSAVQALASSKAKVYVTTPTVPYAIGDLWLKDNKLYKCKTAKDSAGSYDINDWEPATDYTNDAKALAVEEQLNNLKINTGNLLFNGQDQVANMSQWDAYNMIFSTEDLPNSDECKFKAYGAGHTKYYIPFDPNKIYRIKAWLKSLNSVSESTSYAYPSILFYDMDKLMIEINMIGNAPNANPSSLTTLAQDLNPGDTIIHATDLSKWTAITVQFRKFVGIYGYKSSSGFVYPDGTYTRNVLEISNIDTENNTITLKNAYAGSQILSGTHIGQHASGSTYYYPWGGVQYKAHKDWTEKNKVFSCSFSSDSELRRAQYAKYMRFTLLTTTLYIFAPTLLDITEEYKIQKTVKTVDVEYYLSTSSTECSGGSWSTTAPAWVDGKYMWSRQKVTYVDNTTATRNQTCIAGAKGSTGSTGTGIDSITEEYYLSTSKESQTGGSWSITAPTWESGKYIWTRSKIVYKNPASTAYTTPLCSSEWEAINDLEIGGRNLILNSKEEVHSILYPIKEYTLSEDWIDNNEYTLSLKGTVENGNFGIWRNTNAAPITSKMNYDVKKDIYWHTFKCPSTGPMNKISIFNPPSIGKNLFDYTKYLNLATNYEYVDSSYRCKAIPLKPNTQYTVSFPTKEETTSIILLINKDSHVNGYGFLDTRLTRDVKTFTTNDSGNLYIGTTCGNNETVNALLESLHLQIEEGATATSYEPYMIHNSTIEWIKLEKGNKYTDWSPAPEDIKNDITNAVDNLEIGGRNLIRNSSFKFDLNDWKIGNSGQYQYELVSGYNDAKALKIVKGDASSHLAFYQFLNIIIKANTMLTASMKVKTISGNADNLYMRFAGTFSMPKKSKKVLDDGWVLYTYQGKHTADINTESISFGPNGAAGEFIFDDLKLEYGNKPTDWTAAPEDTDTEIQLINTVLNGETGINARLTSAETTIDSIRGKIVNQVIDANGKVITTQTSNGLSINLSGITNDVSQLLSDMTTKEDSQDAQAARQLLQDQLSKLQNNTAFIRCYQELEKYIEDNVTKTRMVPIIELGSNTSPFHLKINNEGIYFVEGYPTFVLTTSEPSDWNTNYNDYYTLSEDDIYVQVQTLVAPTWEANKYYEKDTVNENIIAFANGKAFYNLKTVVQKEIKLGSTYDKDTQDFVGASWSWVSRENGNLGLVYSAGQTNS